MFSKIFDTFRRKSAVNSSLDLFREIYGGVTSSSGKDINIATATQVSTVFACCRVIGNGIAQVPLKVMRNDGDRRIEAKELPIYDLLNSKPNRWQTSFDYRQQVMWHLLLTGNHYSFIHRIGSRIAELYPIDPANVTVKFDRGVMTYEVMADSGEVMTFPAEAIWHIRGVSYNGWHGIDVIRTAAEAIGLAMSTEDATSKLHKNAIMPSGVYSVDAVLSPKDYSALASWVEKHFSGSNNAGKPLILDRAAKWQQTQMTGIDAQTLDQRRYQVEEICRFFGVNPIMVAAESKNTTYASAEQMFLAHVVHTLAPWYSLIEQSIDANLLTERQRRDGHYSNFVEEGLLRGSPEQTMMVLTKYVELGIITPDEARSKLDMNPLGNQDSGKLQDRSADNEPRV